MVCIFRFKVCAAAVVLCLSTMFFSPQTALTEHRILINKGTNQLAFFADDLLIDVFPVATGRLPQLTPEGNWQVVNKLVYPAWRDPNGGPLIPGGVPENPLGPRWLGLNALGTAGGSYGIHGNNSPYSIGTYASSGCIRMRNEDILWLYERVPVGAGVQITSTGQDLLSLKKYDRVFVNGVELEFAPLPGPVQAGEVAYLPIRTLAPAFGCRLTWEGGSNSLLAANIDYEVQMAIGSKTVTVNNVAYETGDAPILLENMTYIPDYYLKDFFGADFPGQENRTLKIKGPVVPAERMPAKFHIKLTVDGKATHLPEELTPLSDGENLLLPLRTLCAAVGTEACWNSDAGSVEIKTKGGLLSIPLDGSPARLDHAVLTQQAHVFVRAGASFVSLDFIQELLGLKAELDYGARTLKILNLKKARIATLILPPVQMSFRAV